MMSPFPTTAPRTRSAAIAFFVATLAAMCTVLVVLPRAGLILLFDGVYPLVLLAACGGFGCFPAQALISAARGSPIRGALSLSLGMGVVSILTFLAGVIGWLSSLTAWCIAGAGIALGVVALARRVSRTRAAALPKPPPATGVAISEADQRSFWTSLIGIAAVGICVGLSAAGATLPPGMLWADEAGGYDALEYHLQAPREYFEAGRIRFLPHNVYASFPQVAEMQYLLLMHLAGGPLSGAIPAQLLHALVGVAAIAAIGAFAPRGTSRLAAVVIAAAIQWISYLGCIAYVENFLVLFAAVASGLLFDAMRRGEINVRTVIAAGLCAGFAAGCKYTALAMVAAALCLSLLLFAQRNLITKITLAAAFTIATAAAFAPWMIRNYAFTGNPFFPFLYDRFGGAAWSNAQNEQWERGHRLSPNDAQLGRARVALRELVGPANAPWLLFAHARFGAIPLLLAIVGGVLSRRHRETWFLLSWCGLILAIWLAMTHMPGRFIVVLAAPLTWLAASAIPVFPRARCALVGLACLGAGIAAGRLASDLQNHLLRFEKRTRVSAALMPGQTSAFRDAHPLAALSADAYVWMIGDAAAFYVPRRCHYSVAFNRDPWLEACASTVPSDCIDALRHEGFTHIYISWSEVRRLRATYGFVESVTPEWAESLSQAGLHRIETQKSPSGELISELFELSRN